MSQSLKLENSYPQLKIAILIAVIFGLVTSVFFMVVESDSYSSIYIVPGSIFHNSDENTVFFKYGVKSSESGKMDYSLEIFVNAISVKSRQFSLNKGEILDEQDKITLPPDIPYPSKISLRLSTVNGIEEVHFWIGRR